MASRRTAGLLVLGSKRDEDSGGGRRYLDGLAMQYLTRLQHHAPLWRWLCMWVYPHIHFYSTPHLCLLYSSCKMYSMFKHILQKWSSRRRGCEGGFALRDEDDRIKTHHDTAVIFPRQHAHSAPCPRDIFWSHPREKNVIMLSFFGKWLFQKLI